VLVYTDNSTHVRHWPCISSSKEQLI